MGRLRTIRQTRVWCSCFGLRENGVEVIETVHACLKFTLYPEYTADIESISVFQAPAVPVVATNEVLPVQYITSKYSSQYSTELNPRMGRAYILGVLAVLQYVKPRYCEYMKHLYFPRKISTVHPGTGLIYSQSTWCLSTVCMTSTKTPV